MIVLDIETVRRVNLQAALQPSAETVKAPSNYKDESKIKEYVEKKVKDVQDKMSLDPLRNQIVSYCILAATDDMDQEKAPVVLYQCNPDESILLKMLSAQLHELYEEANEYRSPLITFNGTRFDIPILVAAFMRNKLPIPVLLKEAMQNRYSPTYHIDLFKILGEEGSLFDWCHALSIQPPIGKGEMVQGWFDKGDFESIKTHNISDVWSQWEIYKRWVA